MEFKTTTYHVEEIKRIIIDHIDDGIKLERICKNHRLTVDDEYLAGFRQGLRVALKIIDAVENGEQNA